MAKPGVSYVHRVPSLKAGVRHIRTQCEETIFNPTIEAINVAIKNSLQKSAGSLKKRIPMITAPTAPMPVHTAYAVPMGKVCVARYKR